MSAEIRQELIPTASLEVAGTKEEAKKPEDHLTSAAAFVEGGIQDACDDACSICLEEFCDNEPSTVTNCKHEFHLQCILEWCQRSSQCPMCLQVIALKDPTSQELLEGVEQERRFRSNTARNATIFHHPALGDFELQHLPVGASDAELEERIIQHLTAAAAMGRTRNVARREGQRNRLSTSGRPQFFVLSAEHNTPIPGPASSSPVRSGDDVLAPQITVAPPSSPSMDASSASRTISGYQSDQIVNNRRYHIQSPPHGQDHAGPSENQSFAESFKTRFNAISMRCKESISKGTRGWKEKFLSRNTSVASVGSEVRDVNPGMSTVTRMMERLGARDNGRPSTASVSDASDNSSSQDSNEQRVEHKDSSSSANVSASYTAGPGSN